jgi:prepilin-type N-terminal cleavage/methylation domain-containing protein
MGCPRKHKVSGSERGFTLIELLVVLVIIAILAAIMIPALTKMKTRSKTATIATDFHTVRDAAMLYNSDNNDFPPDAGPGVYPPELYDYLGRDRFNFANPDTQYFYEWENWTGENGNPLPTMGIAVGFTVHTTNPDLGATLIKRFPNDVLYQTGTDCYTWFIEKAAAGP